MNKTSHSNFPVFALLGDNLDIFVEERFETAEEASAFMEGIAAAVEAQSIGRTELFAAAPGVVQVVWDDDNITKARLQNRAQALAFEAGIQEGGGQYRAVFIPDETYDFNFKNEVSESTDSHKTSVAENWRPEWYVDLLAAPSARAKMTM